MYPSFLHAFFSFSHIVHIHGTRRHQLKMERYTERFKTRNAYYKYKLAGFIECSSGRVFSSLLAKAVYHSTVTFFLCLFTAETNAGQSCRLTLGMKESTSLQSKIINI